MNLVGSYWLPVASSDIPLPAHLSSGCTVSFFFLEQQRLQLIRCAPAHGDRCSPLQTPSQENTNAGELLHAFRLHAGSFSQHLCWFTVIWRPQNLASNPKKKCYKMKNKIHLMRVQVMQLSYCVSHLLWHSCAFCILNTNILRKMLITVGDFWIFNIYNYIDISIFLH